MKGRPRVKTTTAPRQAEHTTDNVPSPIENENSGYGAAKISADLRRLEHRDLWAWMNAVVIILGLTGAVFSLSASL